MDQGCEWDQEKVACKFSPSIQEVEAGESLSWRPAWSIEQILGQQKNLNNTKQAPTHKPLHVLTLLFWLLQFYFLLTVFTY